MFQILMACLLILSCTNKVEEKMEPVSKPKVNFRQDGILQIKTSGDKETTFAIEIAQSQDERVQGLMHREVLEENQGMLFIFPETDYHSFWMKNTYLSLDMVFIKEGGEILHIEHSTTPFSEEAITPSVPCLYVLEVLAGTCKAQNINIGDKVSWKRP